jgi:YVTN family beta-propeller protein
MKSIAAGATTTLLDILVDTQTETLVGLTGTGPIGVAISPDGKMAYVINSQHGNAPGGSVLVIDTATDTQIMTVTGFNEAPLNNPSGVAFSPDGKKAYVVNSFDGVTNAPAFIAVIETKSNRVTSYVPGYADNYYDALLGGVAFSPILKKAYVTFESGTVLVINTENDTQAGTVAVGSGAQGVAFSADGSKAYVACYDDASVAVINAVTDQKTGTISGSDITFPSEVAFSPDGKKAYVTNPPPAGLKQEGHASNKGVVVVINANTDKETGTVAGYDGVFPQAVAFSPDGKKAYVTDNTPDSVVFVVDTATDTVIGNVANYTGSNPADVAFFPNDAFAPMDDLNRGKAYVANYGEFVNYDGSGVSVIKSEAVSVRITSPELGATVPKGTLIVVSGAGEPGMNVNVVLTYQGGRRDLNATVQHDGKWSVNVGMPAPSFTGRMDVTATQTLGHLPVSRAASHFFVG